MNILVTGGAGFIGSHTVVELENAGFRPIILDDFSNSEKSVLDGLKNILGHDVECIEGNCNDTEVLRSVFASHKIDGVIHFAAAKAVGESVENPLKYYDLNVGSLIKLIRTMEEFGVKKMVFSSSCTVYGEPDEIPVTESTPRKPANSPYGNTKTICEDILRDTVLSGRNAQFVALRYFNPIGAHETAEIGELPSGVPSNLVPYITQTAAGLRNELTIFGDDYDTIDGTNIRDFIHVVDLAKAHVLALKFLEEKEEAYYDVFNIGTGKGNSVKELVDTFEEVNGVKLNYKIGPRRPGDTIKIYGDVNKSQDILGWKAEKTLAEALKDAWRWQQKLAERK
ncbi:UDP-glucose 4-epimerase GalE [Marinilongibacter aquaticus]|uniref:UDP-glucose 4-epimerase GalE n=1 Tax=Marinilongibacter aquaticus TaxID=2975157 RepID=UPI0021BD0A1F|nr:UDP-glucose 4-epimerase GalE [Marinilongibacter aquaticus]UBM58452.1 UDP-glucose 4-epimerase GalE [Marinilongibacter aquaticus]